MPSEKHKNSKHSSLERKHETSNEKHKSKKDSSSREDKKSKHKHRSRSRSRDRERSRKKSKKHHKRRSSSSSSNASSSSSNGSAQSTDSLKLIRTLEQRRLERKRQKDALKAKETPEEKRARRLREKQAKEVRRRQRMGWDTEYQHYTNQDNPFGDSNLMSTFVWSKKLEKEGLRNVSQEAMEVLSRQKQMENKLELEKVKKRRMERELERQAREDDMVLQQRTKEAAQFQEWSRQEDQFHLEQARLRSTIRIQDGRAKPIDLLAQYISNTQLEDAIEMQMLEPYRLLNGLGVKDLEDLLVDINVYVTLEKGRNSDFWDDMTVIVEDELQKLQKLELDGELHAKVGGRREGINQSVAKDITEIFRGKNTHELDELKKRIEIKIEARSDGVDISYWESLLSQLKAHMARSRLRDRHQENLRNKLKQLKHESEEENDQNEQNDDDVEQTGTSHKQMQKKEIGDDGSVGDNNAAENSNDGNDEMQAEHNDALDICFTMYDEGNYSPRYINPADLDIGMMILTEEQDDERMDRVRTQFMEKLYEDKTISAEEIRMRAEARKGMLADEAEFSVETTVDNPVQMSSDKYRPRKPRYFNRVHTGFEWNKYNQTHYDMDNPPPKIVQGYKFNIFFPDLINKSATPQYFLTPCEDNPDFAVLRFHAGPPYEDIAFKIVNREWEFSYKRGFRCQFHNNIFQLWFHFKRYRYRR